MNVECLYHVAVDKFFISIVLLFLKSINNTYFKSCELAELVIIVIITWITFSHFIVLSISVYYKTLELLEIFLNVL